MMKNNKSNNCENWIDQDFINLVKPYYAVKDQMHNLEHINRLALKAYELSEKYKIDDSRMFYGVYSHGIIRDQSQLITEYLTNNGIKSEEMELIIRIATITNGSIEPESIEEKIVHDAHYPEGGKFFWVLKSLITGSLREQALMETIRIFKTKLMIENACILPESKIKWEERLKIGQSMIEDLKSNI